MADNYTDDDLKKNFYADFPAIRFFLEDSNFASGFPPALHGYTSNGESLATMIPGWKIHSRLDAMSLKAGTTTNLTTAILSAVGTRGVDAAGLAEEDKDGSPYTRSPLAFSTDEFKLSGRVDLIVSSKLEKTTPGDSFPTIAECEVFDKLLTTLGIEDRYSLAANEVYKYVVDILSIKRREITDNVYSPGYNFVLFEPSKAAELGFNGMSVPHFNDNWFLGYGVRDVVVLDYSLDNAQWSSATLILLIKMQKYDLNIGKYSYSMFV